MPPPDVTRAGPLEGEVTGSLNSDRLCRQINQTISPFWLVVKCCADRDSPDPCPVSPEVPFAAVRTVSTRLRPREKDDAYPIVARLNERWRVIRCADDIQWILQKHSGGRWRGNSFHRDRDVLLQRIAERCGEVDAAALDLVRALPEWYEEGPP